MYALQYHLVQVVKYQEKLFTKEDMVGFLKQKALEISSTFDVEVINKKCDKDHIYTILKAKLTLIIPKYINALKTITSREIRRNFPEVKKSSGKTLFGRHLTSWQLLDR